MALTRFSDIIRNIYKNSVQTDPTTIGNPDAGSVFEGVFDFKRWTKHPDGTIVYSRSDEYTEIIDISGTTITPQLDWNGKFIRWTNTENGVLTLPQTSTLALPEGWEFTIYNDTDKYSISVLTEGTDILKSHNNVFHIPAESSAQFGKLIEGTPNQYYADIEQSYIGAWGAIGQPNVGTTNPVLAGAWTPLKMGAVIASDLLVNVTNPADGSLIFAYPNNGVNGIFASITGTASLALNENNQTADLSFSVNGVTDAKTEVFKQTAQSGSGQTVGMHWPFAFTFSGVLRNGDIIRLVVRSTEATTLGCVSSSLQIRAEALTGVSLTG